MSVRQKFVLRWLLVAAVWVSAACAGCYVGYKDYTEHYTAADTALGEEHMIDYPPSDALELAQDALRGDGIFFETQPDNSIVTDWRPADTNTKTGLFPMVMGTKPRYRYEIQAVPEGGHSSKIIVNVRTEGIPDDELASYKASSRFELFKEIDELAAKYPPKSGLPSSGGVNFTLLPNEDLKALSKRVTGNPDNWREIAKDNGLKSDTDLSPFENIWVRDSLLKSPATP
ncbi:MAG TPA: hypothetical protein VJN94_16840 [Candidatus Binataceae bacterium]|nr:hypothetical protein [Candidatus Binataceae bacterium]